MYISENETIPETLPVIDGVQLQPWFASSVLDQGLQLLREKKVAGFHCIRNAAGALIETNAVVALQFEKRTKLHQGFIIRNRYCSLCRLRQDQKGCAHMAALAILSLVAPAGSTKPIPVPLAFAESGWLKIGIFLYEWLSRTHYTVSRTVGDGVSHWEMVPAEGFMQVNIPESWARQGERLFPLGQQKSGAKKPGKGFDLLNHQLQSWIKTSDERFLERQGTSSKGWKRDASFWIWLARMLFIIHGDKLPGLHRDQISSFFQLQIDDDREPGALTVVLPRAKTWDIVRELYSTSEEFRILPSARECFRVFFNEDNNLEVRPCLRLEDDRILARQRGRLPNQPRRQQPCRSLVFSRTRNRGIPRIQLPRMTSRPFSMQTGIRCTFPTILSIPICCTCGSGHSPTG